MNDGLKSESGAPSIRLAKILSATITVVSGVTLFLFMGNSHEPRLYGPSIASWLVRQWLTPGSHSSHGFLIPLFSLALVWMKRKELASAKGAGANGALIFIAGCLLLYWAGYRAQQPRLGVLCLIGLTWAIPYYLYGPSVARLLVFPSCYLSFAMPMGFMAALTFPLRLLSTTIASALVNGIGIPVIRKGTIIRSAGETIFALNVDDPCSGLNSLVALTALSAAYAYLTQKGLWRQWVLFLLAIPIAMAANVIRILTIAITAQIFGQDVAMRVYHDFSGYIVFFAATALLVTCGAFLQKRTTLRRGTPGNLDHEL